jgi:hypothetical protein
LRDTEKVFSIQATRKLLDRVKQPVEPPVSAPTTALGNWYAKPLFWRPHVVILVNERTLFPVLMPLAPATTLMARVPGAVWEHLVRHGTPLDFIEAEMTAMSDGRFAKTTNRSVVGSMNDLSRMANIHWSEGGKFDDITELALYISDTPCGPLFERHVSPDLELDALVANWRAGTT